MIRAGTKVLALFRRVMEDLTLVHVAEKVLVDTKVIHYRCCGGERDGGPVSLKATVRNQ